MIQTIKSNLVMNTAISDGRENIISIEISTMSSIVMACMAIHIA
ncbi:hypothetical protein [Methanobrevibacter sp. YE315]|nr:hypothetical protein [Methanobrevibacter sp. YE315]